MLLKKWRVWVLVAGMSALACKGHGDAKEEAKKAAEVSRVAPVTGDALGMQPGYLEGGAIHASFRFGRVQSFLQSLPMPAEVVRDIARAGEELGVDLRVDDIAGRFGIAKDAVVSMTLFRPLAATAASVRGDLAANSPFLVELLQTREALDERAAIARDNPPPPQKSAEAKDFEERAGALGAQMRFHVPMADPARSKAEAIKLGYEPGRGHWKDLCPQLGETEICDGERDVLFVVRKAAGGVDIDMLVWLVRPEEPGRSVLEAVREALAAPPATTPELAELRGDVAARVDGLAVFEALRVASLADSVRRMRWSRDTRQRGLDEEAALRQLHEVPRLFEVVVAEGTFAPDSAVVSLRWIPTKAMQPRAVSLFERGPSRVQSPSISGLCTGSLACFRTRGLPPLRAFATLARGPYGEGPDGLERALDRADELAVPILMIETWPNLLGMLVKLPTTIRGPEAVVAQSAISAIEHAEGFGGSLRNLSVGRRSAQADYAAYARLGAAGLSVIRGVLALAEVKPSEVAISGVDGKVEMARLPDTDELPATVLLRTDPVPADAKAATGSEAPVKYGWAVMADGADRLGWLLGVEQDGNDRPAAYAEVGDLWRLFSVEEHMAKELSFAQTWLSGRYARMLLQVDAGSPELRFVLAKGG
jgi:hypothetical protein